MGEIHTSHNGMHQFSGIERSLSQVFASELLVLMAAIAVSAQLTQHRRAIGDEPRRLFTIHRRRVSGSHSSTPIHAWIAQALTDSRYCHDLLHARLAPTHSRQWMLIEEVATALHVLLVQLSNEFQMYKSSGFLPLDLFQVAREHS